MSNEFLLEKYRYILSQKQALNEKTFKIVTFYQSIISLIFAAQFSVLYFFDRSEITKKLALFASESLVWITSIISILSALLLIGGITAWIRYGADGSEIETATLGKRSPVFKKSNIFSWYEIYVIFAILSFNLAHVFVLFYFIIPYFNPGHGSMVDLYAFFFKKH